MKNKKINNNNIKKFNDIIKNKLTNINPLITKVILLDSRYLYNKEYKKYLFII